MKKPILIKKLSHGGSIKLHEDMVRIDKCIGIYDCVDVPLIELRTLIEALEKAERLSMLK